MTIGLLFLFGIANFAIHKAVLESGHPMVAALPTVLRDQGGRLSLGLEFLLLLVALLLAGNGSWAAAWTYGCYSVINAATGWLLLTRRM